MTPISYGSVSFLAHNMREADRVEIFNTLNHNDPEKLAREICMATAVGKCGVSMQAGRPVGIIGVNPIRDGVWAIWSFGTIEWRRGVVEMTRFGARDLRDFILERGAHRMQCESRFDHVEAHRWLELCGAQREGVLRGFGRDGSDYIQFSWTRDEANVFFQDAKPAPRAAAA